MTVLPPAAAPTATLPVLAPAAPPDVVLLPTAERVGPDGAEVVLRRLGDLLAVAAYSSPQALAEHCGDEQPWLAVEFAQLADLAQTWQADLVLLDTSFDAGPSA